MTLKLSTLVACGLLGLQLIAMPSMAEEAKAAAPAAATDVAPAPVAAKDTPAAAETVATVNGVAITRVQLDAILEMLKRSSPTEVNQSGVLDDLIATELARQEAQKAGLAERQDIKDKLKEASDKLILNAWMQDKVSSFKITDEEIKAEYDKRMAAEPKLEYKARHILVKTKEEADSILKELSAPDADFAKIAEKASKGPSGPLGGDLGWFRADSMVPAFAEAVGKMEVNTISKEPVQTQFGFHIIKLEEKRDRKLPELGQMKPQLQRMLEQDKLVAYVRSLREGADVKIMLPASEAKPAAEAAPAPEAKPAAEAAPAPEAKPAAEAAPAPEAKPAQ